MANGIITLSSTRAVLEGRIVWESASQGPVANNSYVAGHLQVRRNDGYTTKGTWTGALRVGGEVQSFSRASTSVGSDWVTMIEFYIYHGHNSDGTGYCFIEGYCNGPTGTSMAGEGVSGNQWVTLDTIPRYANITSLSLKSRTVDSLTFNFTSDRPCRIYARMTSPNSTNWLNNGNPFIDNVTSGEFTINYANRENTTRLSPNTNYTFDILCRNYDSGLDTGKSISATTYDIGKIIALNDFEHGDNVELTTNNPSRS